MAGQSTHARPVQLHVIHDLGGGSAKWLADYFKADRERTNLVLRPYAHDVSMATGLALYSDATSETPIKVWRFTKSIYATVNEHAEYRAALREVLAENGVGAILVSSLIGHSLEALATGLPTVVVMHDYFPWCPAINLYYDGLCGHCDAERIAKCHAHNGKYNPFVDFTPAERVAVRERFVEAIRRPGVVVATPSQSVEANLKRLDPRFEEVRFATIAHGYADPLPHVDLGEFPEQERLRILVLGQISAAKGRDLFEAALPRLAPFADVYLLGCRELGELWKFDPRVTVIGDYRMEELPGHVAAIRPHVGLLMSIVSETFGYALSELFMLGVPVVASRVGSFPERVRQGETGWLFDPDVSSMVNALRVAAASPGDLARMRANLARYQHRTAEEMVSEYHRIAPVQAPADGAPATSSSASAPAATTPEAVQAATLAGMWKHIKSLELQVTAVAEARHRVEMARMTDAEARRKLEERLARLGRELAEREARLLQREMELEDSTNQMKHLRGTIEDLYASTSWRVSKPVRWLGVVRNEARPVMRLAAQLAREPASGRTRARELIRAWRAEGWAGFRGAIEAQEAEDRKADDWLEYRASVESRLKPALVPRVGALARHPVISIVVPIYNPEKDMFRQMLLSVREQIYPYWELCLADDGSTVPYVREYMEEFAAADRRIKLSHASENRGVSHASNRALAMATGEFVVLADHDDIVEEHALYRFAESIVEDDPDFVYSDEVLTTHDRDSVMKYAYRPAFSPELLRSHPYIVHMVGFRAELLRALDGWDESLTISQDYDLILRATEKARRIVHIPEILYRWRIHGSSAGIARQHQVMEVSKSVLARHLERTGAKGRVEAGPSFNLFEPRYDLQPGLKVAIIIPTKNHGDLLRQCVDSIHQTAAGAAYEIVVVDHASDDPATLAYLRTIQGQGQAQVMRYEGPFNFAAINNFAVAQLDGSHTHYLLCNNDIEAYEQGWLERMLELGQQPDVGMVGAKLFYPDRKTIQHAGVCVGMFGAAEHYGKGVKYPEDPIEFFAEQLILTHEVAAVTAACVLVRKDAYAAVRGFDESIAVGFGDVDLCLRIGQAGYRILFCAPARLVHHESFTRGVSRIDPHPVDSALYRIRWQAYMKAGDPYYSPGLSLTSTKWELRRPLPVKVDVRRRITVIDSATGLARVTTSAGRLE